METSCKILRVHENLRLAFEDHTKNGSLAPPCEQLTLVLQAFPPQLSYSSIMRNNLVSDQEWKFVLDHSVKDFFNNMAQMLELVSMHVLQFEYYFTCFIRFGFHFLSFCLSLQFLTYFPNMYAKCHMPFFLGNHYKKASEVLKTEKEAVDEELEKTKEVEELKAKLKKKNEEVTNLKSDLESQCQSREDAIRNTIKAEQVRFNVEKKRANDVKAAKTEAEVEVE